MLLTDVCVADGEDYDGVLVELTFSGDGMQPVIIPIIDDFRPEDLESFPLTIAFIESSDGVVIVDIEPEAVVMIVDNDRGECHYKISSSKGTHTQH